MRMILNGGMTLVAGRVINNPWHKRRMGARTEHEARKRNPLFDAQRIQVTETGSKRHETRDPEEPENSGFVHIERWADVRATTAPCTPKPRGHGGPSHAEILDWMRRNDVPL